jgi:hypothetical protein
MDDKHTRIKQYQKEGKALRTETTINDTTDFSIGKRLTNLPALREIGFSANRRRPRPITGTHALQAITGTVTTATGEVWAVLGHQPQRDDSIGRGCLSLVVAVAVSCRRTDLRHRRALHDVA